MIDSLHLPGFARLPDFVGLWAIEPLRAQQFWNIARGMDLFAHAQEVGQPEVKSALRIEAAANGRNIAVVGIRGPMMKPQSSLGGTSTIQVRRDIRQAAADPNVAGILLEIESPGGTVAGTAELAAEVQRAREKKPVWAQIDDLGASAAYWVASQADRVFANAETAHIGSIGTYLPMYDVSEAAEREGVRVLVFATGPLKGAGVQGSKITDAQIEYFQTLVEDTQRAFDQAVKAGRGMTDQQLTTVRTGAVWTAPTAKKLGLIDGIQSSDRTRDELARLAVKVQAKPQNTGRSGVGVPVVRRSLPTIGG